MAANIATINGKASIAFVGATPWHGLGQRIDESDAYNSKHFAVSSGLDHEMEKVPCVTEDTHQLAGVYAVRRKTDKVIVATVGERYTILQNSEAFEWFQPWLDARTAQLHTAGALGNGARVWVLAKLNLDPMEIVKGDEVDKFVLLSHSHDGTLSVRAGFTPVRAVCQNTLSMAHGSKVSKLIKLKHSKNVLRNLDNLRDTMNLIDQEFEATAEQYRLLARKDINQKDLQKYLKVVFNATEDEEGELSTRRKNIFEDIARLVDSGRGTDIPGVRGTYWAAYQGVNEYLNYLNGRTPENRMNSLWFGVNSNVNTLALSTAVEMAMAV